MVAPAITDFMVVRRRRCASALKRRRSKSAASKVRTTRQARAMSSTMPIRRTCDSYDWPLIESTRLWTRRTTRASSGIVIIETSARRQSR